MVRNLFAVLLLLYSTLSFAQSDSTQVDPADSLFIAKYGIKKSTLGFVGGFDVGMLNDAGINLADNRFSSVEYDPGIGGSLGISTYFFVSENFGIRPQAMVAVVPTQFRYFYPNGRWETFFIYPVVLDVPVHFMIRNPLYTKKVGFFVGPAIEALMPVSNISKPGMVDYIFRADAGLSIPVDLGIGNYLVDVGYGITLDNLLEGDSDYETAFARVYRQRFYVRLNLY